VDTLRALGVDAFEVRTLAQLEQADGLILPGGESTTIARLLIAFDLLEPLRARIRAGLPVWGTCAGAILLAKTIADGRSDQPTLGLMDVTARRNAFGSQLESFEVDLAIDGIVAGTHRAVFIRAPLLEQPGADVAVRARLADGAIVAAQQGHILATCFHPELTDDDRVHRYFLTL